jgi:hypothetical protein
MSTWWNMLISNSTLGSTSGMYNVRTRDGLPLATVMLLAIRTPGLIVFRDWGSGLGLQNLFRGQ